MKLYWRIKCQIDNITIICGNALQNSFRHLPFSNYTGKNTVYQICDAGSSTVKNPPVIQETRFDPQIQENSWSRKWQPHSCIIACIIAVLFP